MGYGLKFDRRGYVVLPQEIKRVKIDVGTNR